MITTIQPGVARDIYHGLDTAGARGIPRDLWLALQRKMDTLHGAHSVHDIRLILDISNSEHVASAAGFYRIPVEGKYDILFKYIEGNVCAVCLEKSQGGTRN